MSMPRRAGDAGGLGKRGPVIAQYRHIYFRVEYFDNAAFVATQWVFRERLVSVLHSGRRHYILFISEY